MADKRAFAVFDVGYLDNPKVMDVFDASCIAVCMHFASVMYCAQHLTDGYVTSKAMRRKTGGTADDAELLIDAGLWHTSDHDCESCPEVPEGKVYVHDYLQHNRTSEGVKGRSEIGKKAADARWGKKESARKSDANGNASRMHDACETHSETQCINDENAMPRQTDRQTVKTSSSPDKPETFDEFWRAYPRKVGKGAAVKAYKAALKKADSEQIISGLETLRIQVAGKDRDFIPHASSWLNAERWEDETPTQAVVNGPWSKEFHK